MAPVANADASTCRKNGLERLGCRRDGLLRIIFMSVSRAFRHSFVHMKGWSFFVRVTRGRAMFA